MRSEKLDELNLIFELMGTELKVKLNGGEIYSSSSFDSDSDSCSSLLVTLVNLA